MLYDKLCALDYPLDEFIDVSDEIKLRDIIVWLELNIIKKWDDSRNQQFSNVRSPDWQDIYQKYKSDIGCDDITDGFIEEVHFIASYAIKIKFMSNKDLNNQHSSAQPEITEASVKQVLDSLDFSTDAVKEEMKLISGILNVMEHPDQAYTMKAISLLIHKRLSTTAIRNPERFFMQGTFYPYKEVFFGPDLEDVGLNEAIQILHLLQLESLKHLQLKSNSLIREAQEITADPKTTT